MGELGPSLLCLLLSPPGERNQATFHPGPQKSGLVEHNQWGLGENISPLALRKQLPLWCPSDLEVIR